MAIKFKTSPKLEALASKHLATLGVPRVALTETQWRIVADSMRMRKWRKWSVVFYIFMAMLCITSAILHFQLASWHTWDEVGTKLVIVDASGKSQVDEPPPDLVRNMHHIILWQGALAGLWATLALTMLGNIVEDWRASREAKRLDHFIGEMKPPTVA